MSTALHSFIDIFDTEFGEGQDAVQLKQIAIPIIQRDYAQGRQDPDVNRVRSCFLDSLYAAVTEKPITLDFIYGNIDDKGIMTPLDGQQRLTTLFLLHWYAARKQNIPVEDMEFLKRFSYETRYSARYFCLELIDYTPTFADVLSKEIINQAWFPLDWKKDSIVLLYAITIYLQNTDSITVEQFARRIRIINNLIQNSEDEVSDRTDRNRIPAILSEVDAIVFTGEIDETIENNFNVNQLVEEKEKITFLKRNPDKAEAVFRLEDHPMLRGQISIVGLDHIDYVDRFYSLFSCTWDKIDCALMSIGNYGQQERNKWRYQFASKGMLYAWNELFHKSANSGFENTKKTLVQLLASAETFTDDTLQTLTDKYITACEAAGLYPWRYYYVKYPVFRPGVYGKLSNSHADEKPYLFSVMQTKTQWSSNTYMPYLKAADGAHLSKDFMGQRLIYGDRHIICANNAYLLRNNDDESVIDIVRISQSEVGIDLEDRIKKLKAYITTL